VAAFHFNGQLVAAIVAGNADLATSVEQRLESFLANEAGDITGVTAGTGLSGGGTTGTVTVNFDPISLTAATAATDDYVVITDTSDSNTPKRSTVASIVSYAPQGDITSVVAGTNLNGGGTTGDVTLNVDASPSFTNVTASGQFLAAAGSHAAPSYSFSGDTDTGFFKESSNTIGSTGNLIMSKATSSATLTVSTFADAAGTESLLVLRSADGSIASPALRDNGDNLGEIHFSGHDGTDYAIGAKIRVYASAVTGNNDMPSTMEFQTTPDSSSTPVARLTIDHTGKSTFSGATQHNNTVTVGVDDTGYDVKFFGATAGHYMQWDQTNNRALVVGGSGQIGTNVTVPVSTLEIASDDDLTTFESGAAASSDRGTVTLTNNNHDPNDLVAIDFRHSFGTTGVAARIAAKMTGGGSNLLFGTSNSYNGVTNTAITIDQYGAVAVHGALSKGSGTFDIPHPTRSAPWRLRHSFIEGPKADLIYRGTATIPASGSTTVDLDAESGMTDGTWEALNQDPWSMVTSSGNVVTWSLSGKTLTITGPPCVTQWMVIGERRDQTVIDWRATDSDGHLITEYDPVFEEVHSNIDQLMKV